MKNFCVIYIKLIVIALSVVISGVSQAKSQSSGISVLAEIGLNAPQITIENKQGSFKSSGYVGTMFGAGILYTIIPSISSELDLIYAQRRFGFGNDKGYLPVIQMPFTGIFSYGMFDVSGGLYISTWISSGEIIVAGKTKTLKASDLGYSKMEIGHLLGVKANSEFWGIPLFIAFKRLQSISNLAAKNNGKSNIVEYQILTGVQLALGK